MAEKEKVKSVIAKRRHVLNNNFYYIEIEEGQDVTQKVNYVAGNKQVKDYIPKPFIESLKKENVI